MLFEVPTFGLLDLLTFLTEFDDVGFSPHTLREPAGRSDRKFPRRDKPDIVQDC
jgi:hypothetical protein